MRTRNIKPSIFKNELLGTADPLLTLLFEGLWCLADCNGVLEDRPLRIKAEIFPYRNVDCDKLLNALASMKDRKGMPLVIRYESEGNSLLAITKFREHQNPHPKEPSSGFSLPAVNVHGTAANGNVELGLPSFSLLPSPNSPSPKGSSEPATPTSEPPQSAALIFPVVGKKDGKPVTEWPLLQSKVDEYSQSYPGVDILAECRKALQWCRDNPLKRKTFGGMAAFLTRWLSKAQDRGGSNGKAISRPASSEGKPSMKDLMQRLRKERAP